jgi:hypothetical protein
MNHLILALAIYTLAILISMLVAIVIKGIVASVALGQKKPPPAVLRPVLARDPLQDDIVVITAAVYAMLGPHRIVHIDSGERSRLWTAAARASHHSSHNIRHLTRPR